MTVCGGRLVLGKKKKKKSTIRIKGKTLDLPQFYCNPKTTLKKVFTLKGGRCGSLIILWLRIHLPV